MYLPDVSQHYILNCFITFEGVHMAKRTISELIDMADPALPLIQRWIKAASHSIEILEANRARAEKVLLSLQVTTHSPLGAVAFETGGILIDRGWLRFLGSGHERMRGNLLSWNTAGTIRESYLLKNALVVAHDAVGGFFALNGGAFPGKPGIAFYFAPDTLTWQNTNLSYSQLLNWAMVGNLEIFYKNIRWPGWEQELSALSGDQGISIYPFLWANREIPVEQRSRRVVPLDELWRLQADLAQQLKDLPEGTLIQVNFEDNPQITKPES
jgi:hypothetical protein